MKLQNKKTGEYGRLKHIQENEKCMYDEVHFREGGEE